MNDTPINDDALRGNVWHCWPDRMPNVRLAQTYDVAILGAGVVGCALAYRLSQFDLRAIVIDKCMDVGEGTSKGNSAIIHTGFDATVGSLESQLVTKASVAWPALAQKLKIPFDPISAVLIATDDEQSQQLPSIVEKAHRNGVDDVELISAQRVCELEPNVTDRVRGGVVVARESIIDPFTTSVAYAEVAATNGVDFLMGAAVTAVEDAHKAVKTIRDQHGHRIKANIVVNVAGLGGRRIADLYGGAPFSINPRRGQFVLYDRNLRSMVNRILLPVPTKKTKGKLVTPTIFGNLLAGPTAEDLPMDMAEATQTTIDGLEEVATAAHGMCPALQAHRPIASYAGLRCNCAQGSYHIVVNDPHSGIVTVTGIRSTGLTSSPALADYLIERLTESCGLDLTADARAVDERRESKWPGWWRRMQHDGEAGAMTCFCELITTSEIEQALSSPLCPPTMDAIKRRTRAMTGRCQAFNCGVAIAKMSGDHAGVPAGRIVKHGPGSELVEPSGAKP